MDNVDVVIENVSNFINEKFNNKEVDDFTLDMIKALANLISARAM